MLAVGAGGGCLDIFALIYRFSFGLNNILFKNLKHDNYI